MYRDYAWRFAVISRIVLVYFSAVCNSIVSDHVSLDAFQAPLEPEKQPKTKLDGAFQYLFGGLLRWDAQHFFHISRHGYTYENNLAFFPFYPMTLRLTSTFLKLFIGGTKLDGKSLFLLTSVTLNIFIFSRASVALYDLTLKLYKSPMFAYKTSIFFCLSPATVFFLAPYSETLFAFLVFNGMLQAVSNKKLHAALLFTLSSAVRSNGILNVGFILHALAYELTEELRNKSEEWKLWQLMRGLRSSLAAVFSLLIIVFPYLIFQGYGFYLYCLSKNRYIPDFLIHHANRNGLSMATNVTDWCESSLPFPYFHIQKKYWSVGLFGYYDWHQIPNFILALPIIGTVLYFGLTYLNLNRSLLLKPGIIYNRMEVQKEGPTTVTLPKTVFLHVAHAVALTIFCTLFINIQVTTRMLASSSPVIYWIAAGECIKFSKHRIDPKQRKSKFFWKILSGNSASRAGQFIRVFFIAYAVAGILLFTNNYPWT